jgi:hypothetical protein
MRRNRIFITVAVVAIAVAAWGTSKAYTLYQALYVRLPEYAAPKKAVWLNQNVSKERLDWFYHADQGTRTFGIPYEWFVALEQPEVSLRVLPMIGIAASGAFSDPDYLNRYGFIADTIAADSKALPIGFARGGPMLQDNGEPWLNPQTQEAMTGIGLTCAACHTGRFTYRGHRRHRRRRRSAHRPDQAEAGDRRLAIYDAISVLAPQPFRLPHSGGGRDAGGEGGARIAARPGAEAIQGDGRARRKGRRHL